MEVERPLMEPLKNEASMLKSAPEVGKGILSFGAGRLPNSLFMGDQSKSSTDPVVKSPGKKFVKLLRTAVVTSYMTL